MFKDQELKHQANCYHSFHCSVSKQLSRECIICSVISAVTQRPSKVDSAAVLYTHTIPTYHISSQPDQTIFLFKPIWTCPRDVKRTEKAQGSIPCCVFEQTLKNLTKPRLPISKLNYWKSLDYQTALQLNHGLVHG